MREIVRASRRLGRAALEWDMVRLRFLAWGPGGLNVYEHALQAHAQRTYEGLYGPPACAELARRLDGPEFETLRRLLVAHPCLLLDHHHNHNDNGGARRAIDTLRSAYQRAIDAVVFGAEDSFLIRVLQNRLVALTTSSSQLPPPHLGRRADADADRIARCAVVRFNRALSERGVINALLAARRVESPTVQSALHALTQVERAACEQLALPFGDPHWMRSFHAQLPYLMGIMRSLLEEEEAASSPQDIAASVQRARDDECARLGVDADSVLLRYFDFFWETPSSS